MTEKRSQTSIQKLLSLPERPIEAPDAAKRLIDIARHPWSFGSLALGWMKLDVMLRFLAVVALAVVPVWMTIRLDERLADADERLRKQGQLATDLTRDPAAWASEGKVREIALRYAALAGSAEEYRGEIERLGRLQVIAVAGLGVLLVLVAVGQYRRYIAVRRVKQAVDFLMTPEGARWLAHQATSSGTSSPPPAP